MRKHLLNIEKQNLNQLNEISKYKNICDKNLEQKCVKMKNINMAKVN